MLDDGPIPSVQALFHISVILDLIELRMSGKVTQCKCMLRYLLFRAVPAQFVHLQKGLLIDYQEL